MSTANSKKEEESTYAIIQTSSPCSKKYSYISGQVNRFINSFRRKGESEGVKELKGENEECGAATKMKKKHQISSFIDDITRYRYWHRFACWKW